MLTVMLWIVISSASAFIFFDYCFEHYQRSKIRQARLMLEESAKAIEAYRIVNGKYPSNLAKAIQNDKVPYDPWGNQIIYRTIPSVKIISTGPDGRQSSDDIVVELSEYDVGNITAIKKEDIQ